MIDLSIFSEADLWAELRRRTETRPILPFPTAKIDYIEEWDLVPKDLPPSWRSLRGGSHFVRIREHDARADRLSVMLSASIERDGRRWLHASLSKPKKLPTYGDMVEVKNLFIGPDRTAYQIFARDSEHVSLHDTCLHLWSCLDHDVTPDFRSDDGLI